MGFPCLILQQGHCPREPAPDPGERLSVGWYFLAGLPSPASPRDLAAHPEQERQGEKPAPAPKGPRPPHRGQPVLLGQLLWAHRLKLQPEGIKGGHLGKFLHVEG